ncbi:hypothetical protein BRD14_01305 [Halobacteriales archaeon SW_5_68_122]|nr:MAG: hypothetical protein BRD14_01305 [Halobacteriales archaeon SW_5_68_122]
MDADTVVDEWEASPFDGGLDELGRLRSRGFSGAVEAGSDWLFLAGGEPVAVVSDLKEAPQPGDIDAFEGASGRAHEAPHPTAARLVPMLALEGEVRGEYFTDDTPLSTVHETLSDGGFSGEEAESKAKNEVGIYGVVAVDLPDLDLPEAADPASAGAGAAVRPDDGGGSDATDGADAGPFEEPGGTTASGDGHATEGREAGSEPMAGGPGSEPGEAGASETEAPATDDDPGGTDEPDEATAVPSVDPERSGPADAVEADEWGDATEDADAAPETTPPATGTADTATGSAGVSSELDALRSELSSLRRTQKRLEERVAALESGGTTEPRGDRPGTGPSLSPAEALEKTTLFVREGTRGGPTLEDIHAGRADRESLSANVRLEPHTRFNSEGAGVDAVRLRRAAGRRPRRLLRDGRRRGRPGGHLRCRGPRPDGTTAVRRLP